MKKIIPFLIITLIPLNIFCQQDSSALISLMKAQFEAFQKKDPSQWSKNVDENATFAVANNLYKTKAQIIEEIKSAPDIFISATETYNNVFIKIYGNTAILACLTNFSFTSSDGNLNKIKFKFTRVHIKESSGWKLVYHSAILIEN